MLIPSRCAFTRTCVQQLKEKLLARSHEDRAFFFALVSCPWPLTSDCIRNLSKAMGRTYKSAQAALDLFAEEEFLTAIRLEAYSYSRKPKTKLSIPAILAALQVMTPNDVVTLRYAEACKPSTSRSSYYDYEFVEPSPKPEDYAQALLRCISEDPASVRIENASETEPSELINRFEDIWFAMIGYPEKKALFKSFSQTVSKAIYDNFSTYFCTNWTDICLFHDAISVMALTKEAHAYVEGWFLFNKFLHEGHLEQQVALISTESCHSYLLQAILFLSKNNHTEAVRLAKKALKARPCHKFKYFIGPLENFFYGLILYADRNADGTQRTLNTISNRFSKLEWDECLLGGFALVGTQGVLNPNYITSIAHRIINRRDPLGIALFVIFSFYFDASAFFGRDSEKDVQPLIQGVAEDFPVIEQAWVAVTDQSSPQNTRFEKTLGMKAILSKKPREALWAEAINQASDLLNALQAPNTANGNSRISYLVDTNGFTVYPRLQKRQANGNWSSGRNIAIKTFYEREVPGMTPQDLQVADQICSSTSFYGGRREYYLVGTDVIRALIGHPFVFDFNQPEMHLEVTKGEVQLTVLDQKGKYEIKTNIDDKWKNSDCVVLTSTPGVLEVIDVSPAKMRVIQAVQKVGPLPSEAKDKLTPLLERLSEQMPVMSNLLKNSANIEKKKASSKITVQLSPNGGEGFSAKVVVRPLEDASILCEPGTGLASLALSIKGHPVRIERNLAEETKNFQALLSRLQSLDEYREDTTHWILPIEPCLELLEAVRNMKGVVVEWPDGEKLRVARSTIGFENLKVSIKSLGSWFELNGEVKLDAKTRLKMDELLKLVRQTKGNFIALNDTEYVALTDGLRKQLATLDRLSEGAKNPKISAFNSGLIDDLEKAGAEVATDKAFRDLRTRIASASNITPTVPAGLQAELRDYQTEGFAWMSRLASWGAGALLADDMGLGKTVQAITLLLSRASMGPQLVVVPASVLFNWRNELARFAPSLEVQVLNEVADRSATLAGLKKNAVGLTTYGILTSEIDAVREVTWTSVVLDEAHNIKNRETKSFKATLELKADFRLLLTGTPLQNHLAEVWALFEVAVPGLLGTFTHFTDRFVLPIERDGDREQQRLLKRIVSPFILRRTKSDVLDELPEKTELTVKVELSPEERALYEKLREEAQLTLASGEAKTLQALAMLTKLRQAACAPELVDAKLRLPSSKTAAFLTLARELIENRHRALVFSQFTTHLALIRRELDKAGISYLYLDGSMSPAVRAKLVEEFKSSDMPLFLISLKAGGTGLNLTAADYVIHLDPWWNPAIEDQASDRAYRIGQERPVTIYRLIAANTVEEKILKLHATKKSLADALLEGTDMSKKLGREEIMELLALAQ